MGDQRKLKPYDNNNKKKPIKKTVRTQIDLPELRIDHDGQDATTTDSRQQQEQPPVNTRTSDRSSGPVNRRSQMGRKSLRDRDKGRRSSATSPTTASGGKRASTGGGVGGPVKERWLLTRKTWKYMTDAGRRLIPEGIASHKSTGGNRATPEEVNKIEEHFQNVCRNEPKFVLWRRKCSYPGALVSLKNRSRAQSKNNSSRKLVKSTVSSDDDEKTKEQQQNNEKILSILQNYLIGAGGGQERKSSDGELAIKSTPIVAGSSKTVRIREPSDASTEASTSATRTGPSGTAKTTLHLSRTQQISGKLEEIQQLLDSLKKYTQTTSKPLISPDRITMDILENKTLLRQIYNDLKQQQLQRILGRHCTPATGSGLTLPHASSLSSLWSFRRDSSKDSSTSSRKSYPGEGIISSKSNLSRSHLRPSSSGVRVTNTAFGRDSKSTTGIVKKPPPTPPKTYSTAGTQTDFIHLHVLQRMAKEYEANKKLKDEELIAQQLADEDSDKSGSGASGGGATGGGRHHRSRRKSSIDNEDVSQSVSDTIKRYLRMARKKSVNDDHANRFKRVNYDRNLRNIRAKGEINPPGMDEDNSKAVQTLDAWTALALDAIRGCDDQLQLAEAHADWQRNDQQRKQQQQQYLEQQQQQQQQQNTIGACPPSPSPSAASSSGGGGLLHSGQQFLSNLWHGHHHTPQDSPNSTSSLSINSTTTTTTQAQQRKSSRDNMQKSKSSSNVGQFVSKKIWKSRSKSQVRTQSPDRPQWTPQGNCIWTSSSGRRVQLYDAKLADLTEIERKILHRVAIDKINQLNIGVNVTTPGDSAASVNSGSNKKRRPLLIKRKALTTSFFDTGKKDDSRGLGSGLVFGVSLEKCLDNDYSRAHKGGATASSGHHSSDRGSRNSIASLLGGGGSSKGSENIGSCESLPLSRSTNFLVHSGDDPLNDGGVIAGGNLNNSSVMQLSRSQSDMRRTSHDDDDLSLTIAPPPMAGLEKNSGHQVPGLVIACIRHLEEHGLHTVGIFRVSTSKKRVRQLKEDFDRGEVTSIDPETCPHDVATLLKEYLRDLPEPLLCRNLYKAFVKTQKIRNRRLQLEALSHLVQLLPVAHRDTLYELLKFLAKIVRSSDDVASRDGVILSVGNKMDSSNLATVFAPNILHYSLPGQNATTEQEIDEQIDVINVIRTMIDHFEELFRVPSEIIDEIYTNMMDSYPTQLNYLCDRRDLADKLEYGLSDDMDSGSSTTTPLCSPPPVMSPSHNQQHQSSGGSGYSFGDQLNRRIYLREDFLHENAAKGGDPNGNSVAARRRRRDRYMMLGTNQQTAQATNNINNNNSNVVGVIGGQNILDDSHSTALLLNKTRSSSTDSSSTQSPTATSAGGVPVSPTSRRLSSPFVLHGTGVVTASLKIPVQMQAGSNIHQQQHNQWMGGTVMDSGGGESGGGSGNEGGGGGDSCGRFDLSDIPYIEDNNVEGIAIGIQQQRRPQSRTAESQIMSGSLSISPNIGRKDSSGTASMSPSPTPPAMGQSGPAGSSGSAATYQIPISFEGRLLNPSLSGTHNKVATSGGGGGGYEENGGIPSSGQAVSSPTRKRSESAGRTPARKQSMPGFFGGTAASKAPQTQSHGRGSSAGNGGGGGPYYMGGNTAPLGLAHTEPKITPSITNIGGAVLRSKTADFERILMMQNKKHKTGDTIPSDSGGDASAAQRGSTQTSSNVADQQQDQQQLSQLGQKPQQPQRRSSQGPIYKRQELISSAQRSPK